MGRPLLADLEGRDLVHDSTDRDALAARLAQGPLTVYCGFDPTADSLHVGHLVGLVTLRRFQLRGHRPIALAGGATGMIGDPSGRSTERILLDEATLAANVASIREQLRRLLDFEPGPAQAVLADNNEWIGPMRLIPFLRDVGKHITVNQMVAKESVKARMQSDEGISYTEFSYLLLQAVDFLELNQRFGCELQIGGSDQWGNITAGIDLIRRRRRVAVHGLTWPLLTRPDGTKFGKSEGEHVWLAPERTSPYRFYQFWIQVDDRAVVRLLRTFTFLHLEEIDQLAERVETAPERREAQRTLARGLTDLVHGPAQADAVEQASALLFGGTAEAASPEALAALAAEVPTSALPRDRFEAGVDLVDLLSQHTGLCPSKGDARRTIAQGGAYLNNRREPESRAVTAADLLHGRWLLLRRGKASYHLVETA